MLPSGQLFCYSLNYYSRKERDLTMHLLVFVSSYILSDANKTGVAHEAINNIRRASKTMTEQEARQILGVSENSTWEEIVQVCYFAYLQLSSHADLLLFAHTALIAICYAAVR
jgi:hypothetical protein